MLCRPLVGKERTGRQGRAKKEGKGQSSKGRWSVGSPNVTGD